MHVSLLAWQRYRLFWWALGLTIASILLYATQGPEQGQPANGGTWQGYTLGTVGALLIVWLSLLGVRKYNNNSCVFLKVCVCLCVCLSVPPSQVNLRLRLL